MPGAALYVWHCDRLGGYSMYDGWAETENYLRGVQVADEDGWLEFTTIFPGCYPGRWPHVHFEVYPSLRRARQASDRLRTSQLAFPEDVCREVYASPDYDWARRNFEEMAISDDMVFADGFSLQMATMSGEVGGSLAAALNVPV